MALSGDNLSLVIGGAPLLGGVSIAVSAGSVTAVMGPNGAGKTSLARVLCGEWKPTEGTVALSGRGLHDWPAGERAKHLAVLPQHSVLNFPFTAEEVVMLGRIPHDTGIVHDQEIVEAALAAVDGSYLATRDYMRLSGGERQRVHFARVLAQIWEPPSEGERFLILDEPTASFDLAHQQLTLEVVRRLADQGVGVLIVLHDLNLAARCADQVLLLQCGTIAAAGSPQDVLTEDNLQSVFQVSAHIGTHPVTGTPLVIT